MKAYNIQEFAQVTGVTAMTIQNWIKKKLIIPKRTETGQPYFTSENVAYVFYKLRFKAENLKGTSTLYLLHSDSNEQCEKLTAICHTAQKKGSPKSIFVSSFQTFLTSAIEHAKDSISDESIEKALRGQVVFELSKRLMTYVQERVLFILNLDPLFKKDFTWSELEALVLNDKENFTDNLEVRFDNAMRTLREDPKNSDVNADGSVKKKFYITSSFLAMQIQSKVSDLARKLGFTNPDLYGVNYAKIAYLSTRVDTSLAEIILNDTFKINLSASDNKKLMKNVLLTAENTIVKTKISEVMENGYYLIYRLCDTEEDIQAVYNILDMCAYKEIVLVGSDSRDLPSDIRRKIEAGVTNGNFEFTQI